MSRVTNYMLSFSCLEDIAGHEDIVTDGSHRNYTLYVPVESLNARLHGERWAVEFANLNAHFSGKVCEAEVWGTSPNRFGLDEMARAVVAQEWKAPEDVQLFVQGQEDESFTVYTLAQLADIVEEEDADARACQPEGSE